MSIVDIEHLRNVKTLRSLVKFLHDELDWPVETKEIDDLTFDYKSEELGLDPKHAAKVKEIKQLRPLDSKQPWGIFWISFEKKRLPMVVLRRILGNLVITRRASARKADHPSWRLNDLLFISSYGEEEHRTVSFAHFTDDPDTDELPVLRVLGWDDQNSIMHLDRVVNQLHSHFRWPDDSTNVEKWRKRWSEAFTDRYREAIRSADQLIPRIADLASAVRRRVRDVLDAEIKSGPMRRLFAAVQKLLIHDMDEDAFADMYAQTVAYGLLSASFSRPAALTAQNLVQLTAVSNPFLENLLENLFRINRGKYQFDVDEVGINDVLDLLRNTNIEAIKAAFSDKNPAEDPVIRFYEGFLKAYDPEQRIQRGVFFTPRPVVSYIVRSVHELLQTEFDLEDGLASTATWGDMKKSSKELSIPEGAKAKDPFVCILDPAVGTATFLYECIEVIERTMKDKWCRELGKKHWNDPDILKRWRDYVPRYLLPRLYGYELMMAPYAIAHVKLALKLGETGYQFQDSDRLHIYLTNSLEPPTPLADLRLADMFTTLAAEAQEVNEVKASKYFTVVIGNPPYSKLSQNKNQWIHSLMERYKTSIKTEEIQRQALSNDYVKFLCLSTYILEHSENYVFSMITDNSYLDGPLFRDMRSDMLETFEAISITNLGGNLRKKASTEPDDNVFDIQQGVAIFLGFKASGRGADCAYIDIRGSQDNKSRWLLDNSNSTTSYRRLKPLAPQYYLLPTEDRYRPAWEKGVSLPEIFAGGTRKGRPLPFNGAALATRHDRFAIAFTRNELKKNLAKFYDPKATYEELADCFCLCQTSHFSFARALNEVTHKEAESCVRKILYRPFDYRFVLYHPLLIGEPRPDVMLHLLKDNIALLSTRRVTGRPYDNVFVCRGLVEYKAATHDRNTQVFPLYLYGSVINRDSNLLLYGNGNDRQPNLSLPLYEELRTTLHLNSPKDLLSCIYGILYSPTYRFRFQEKLQREYARFPIPKSPEMGHEIRELGAELIALHLLESSKLDKHITKWRGATPSGEIEKVTYSDETVWIDKAKTEGFKGVPEEVWNFHIGGYQVCEKWLKDRGPKKGNPGRKLSKKDIEHYQKIVIALKETIRLMAEIDKVIDKHGGWPNAFVTDKT